MGTYLVARGRALKPRPTGNEPAERGPLTGHDPCPLTSTEGGVDPASSRAAHEPLKPLACDAPTEAAGGCPPVLGCAPAPAPKMRGCEPTLPIDQPALPCLEQGRATPAMPPKATATASALPPARCGGINPYTLMARLGPAQIRGFSPP